MKEKISTAIATGLYSGFMKPYPGTWGTIPAWLIAFFLIRGDQTILIAAVIVSTVLSVWAAGEAEHTLGHDARKIVIDEWAGMFVTLLFIPYSLPHYIIAFLAFRLFDVIKIFPARQAESLPGGWGVTADDLIGGFQANIAFQIALYFIYSFQMNLPFLY